MKRVYYKKYNKAKRKTYARAIGVGISAIGLTLSLFIFLPMVGWQIFSAPIFLSQSITAPIPQIAIVNAETKRTFTRQVNTAADLDSTDAGTWFPQYSIVKKQIIIAQPVPTVNLYTISIPKINIDNALVSTQDNDLAKHIVNFAGTAVPPENGNSVLFAHSTLPYLFDSKNYRTILANANKLGIGDEIIVHIGPTNYRYEIYSITIVKPDDTSVFVQNYDTSYLTLITCDPPGTTWERLVIKSRIEK